MLHPLGDAESAIERTRVNELWWKGLTERQRRALIDTYPEYTGNAEGIPPLVCQEANSLVLQAYLEDRDELVARSARGIKLDDSETDYIKLMDRLDKAMREAADVARTLEVDGPYLLRFDPLAFDGHGRMSSGSVRRL